MHFKPKSLSRATQKRDSKYRKPLSPHLKNEPVHANERSTYVLLSFACVCAYLWKAQDLDYYIHPRYELFTVLMSVACIMLCMIYAIQKTAGGHSHYDSHTHRYTHTRRMGLLRRSLGFLPLAAVLIFAVALPSRSLQSVTVSQRATNLQNVNAIDRSQMLQVSGSSRGLSIVDWSQLLQTNTDEAYYKNKPAKISGFIYDAQLGSDAVWIARFAVTCCAVDAQPLGVPIFIERWHEQYTQDQWIEVEGEFQNRTTRSGTQLVLVPTSIKPIEEPQNPYVN